MWGTALQVAETVESILIETDQTYNRLFLPDTLRKVAVATGQAVVMQHAIDAYQQALPDSNPRKLQKLAATYSQFINIPIGNPLVLLV